MDQVASSRGVGLFRRVMSLVLGLALPSIITGDTVEVPRSRMQYLADQTRKRRNARTGRNIRARALRCAHFSSRDGSPPNPGKRQLDNHGLKRRYSGHV